MPGAQVEPIALKGRVSAITSTRGIPRNRSTIALQRPEGRRLGRSSRQHEFLATLALSPVSQVYRLIPSSRSEACPRLLEWPSPLPPGSRWPC